MKQTMQQTAVQRALQPPARPSPKGPEQFDMAAVEEEPALADQFDERDAGFEKYQAEQAKKRARIAAKNKEALAKPGQIDDMMVLGSAAASSSGYGVGSSTAIVPVSATTQEPEDPPRYYLRGGHRRTDSATSAASATSAISATSTATTVAIPKQMRKQIDIDILIKVAKDRRREWNQSEDIDKIELSMEISDLMYKIEKLRSGIIPNIEELRSGRKSKSKSKTKADEDTAAAVAASAADIVAKKRLMDIMEMPE